MNNNAQSEPDSRPNTFTRFLKKLFKRGTEDMESVLETLREAKKNSIVDADALSIIEGAMQATEMQVREIMIPRTQITSVKYNMEPKELLSKIIESGHSRFPVIGENPDEIIGILLAKDLLSLQLNEKLNIKDKMRQATVIPESKRVNVLLKEFRNKRNHMAIVVNEYGGISGLVTIEDVLEQIVGDIEDEHDVEDSSLIKSLDNHEYVIKAITPVWTFNEYFLSNFSDSEYETIGGIVLQSFERLPKRGESVEINGINFTVLHSDSRSIKLLKVTLKDEQLQALLAVQASDSSSSAH
jgi:magnesium and cobalt transporter